MGIEHPSKPPGVIHRDPLHRYEPGIAQMTKQLGDRLDLPSTIAAKYQRTLQTSSLNTLGHRLQRKEAIGPADSELISGFGHRSPPPISELSAQTPQIARQADVVVPSPVPETTQRFRIRRSPQGDAGGQAIETAMAGGPLNPPILGDFESGSRAPQPLAEVAGGSPLNPPILGDFEPGSTARSPQNWGLGGDSIAQPQAETIVQRKVQTAAPTKAETTIYQQTNIQRSPTSPLQLHRQTQVDEIKRYAIDSSEVLQHPTTTTQSETGASPLLLHSQAIVQRLPNDGYTTIPLDQRIAPSRSETSAPSSRSDTSAPSPDITGLVDHISRIMARQLAVERERRGL
jgi:hypothetical protein